jgi:CBS domain-containing protein
MMPGSRPAALLHSQLELMIGEEVFGRQNPRLRQRRNEKMSRISPQRATRTTNKADSGPPGLMYRFLECTVGQYMTCDVTIVTRQGTLRDLEALFEKHDFNSFPVVEEGKMLGIVTKFDFLKAFVFTTGQMVPHYDELMKRPVAEIMTEAVIHVEPATPLTRVLELMVSLKARSFPVIGPERELVGVISREDVIRALRETTQEAR